MNIKHIKICSLCWYFLPESVILFTLITNLIMKRINFLYIILAFASSFLPIFSQAMIHKNATADHTFMGVWLTTPEFECLQKTKMFHRQLDDESRKCIAEQADKILNRHILFRKDFTLSSLPKSAKMFFSADDYAKIYINGNFVAQGPTPAYNFHYFYHEVDISKYLQKGRNVIAVHSYYQGLVNRVWVSGDYRHAFICDILCDNKLVLKTDETWKWATHSGFKSIGEYGYRTQFAEHYNAGASEVLFASSDFNDDSWQNARNLKVNDYTLFPSPLPLLDIEYIAPTKIKKVADNKLFVDFGKMYVGYFSMLASGKKGDVVETRFGQELNDDGSVRFNLRAMCKYQEYFELSGKARDELNQFDYKSFRYAEVIIPKGVEVDESSIKLLARHYPFELKAKNRYAGDPIAEPVWELCVHSLKYGVQEQVQDCMEREKGYYLGDGVYTILTHALITKDYAPMRKFVDDFFRTSFINEGLVTCANCSHIQEIAEFPLMMFLLMPVLAEDYDHKEFLRERMCKFRNILDYYKKTYAQENGLLNNLDKWCVVEWPYKWRDGYDVKLSQDKVCSTMHNAINAWYLGAIKAYNKAAKILNEPEYADETKLKKSFIAAFYDEEKMLFKDSVSSEHISFCANAYCYFLGLYPNEDSRKAMVKMIDEYRLTKGMLFSTFPVLAGLQRDGEDRIVYELLTDKRTWHSMLAEGATATFEGWYKKAKWNTSLFHLTLSCAAAFMVDYVDIGRILDFNDK